MKNNTITWEQAVQVNKHQEVGEYYTEQIRAIVMFFARNTIFQLSEFSEIYWKALDLGSYLNDKDYSKFLFDECDKLIKEFEERLKNDPKTQQIITTMQSAAKAMTESIKLIRQAEQKDNESNNRNQP